MAWDERWEKWRQENAAELKLLRELIIKMRGEQFEGSSEKAGTHGSNPGPISA